MKRVLYFTQFLSENYSRVVLENEKKSGNIIISDLEGDEEFSQKTGVPYIRIKDDSIEFTKSTPVDTATLAINGPKTKKPGVYFYQSKLPNPPVEKRFFTQEQAAKNSYDILLQIYTLFYKEDLQDADVKLLSDLVNSVLMVEKNIGNIKTENPAFFNFINGLKETEKAESSMKEHSKYLDEKAKKRIIETVSSVTKTLA